ncbi:Leucine rich repeat [Popillia japonica]|uniref:Leucine rich repeat n=1 Tax=Popillia japonica TaxID=7064 RepID=A0AAW1LSM1_POPJA
MLVFLLLILATAARDLCPTRCRCNNEELQAYCANAALEVVPIQLNPEITSIDLSDNRISTVHLTLYFYHNLVFLDLARNKIQTLGTSNFESQRNLKYLNLSNNDLETLSKDCFKGLKALIELDLSYNKIDVLAKNAFREMHSLQILRLTGNQIISLEDDLLEPVKSLQQLYLDSNQLLNVPKSAIRHCVKLKVVSLSQNLLISIDEDYLLALPELQTLELSSNVLNDLHPAALSGLSSLEDLDLSDNNFTAVPTASLTKLSKLKSLRLSGNYFTTVPPVAFRGLFQLKYLRLDRLELLTKIDSRALVDNINLEEIWLDDNIALENLPTRLFHGNPKITHISVRNCKLITLEVSHFPLDQLKWLKLGGNPLACNCSILWLWRLVQIQKKRHLANHSEYNDLLIDADDIVCDGPEPLTGLLLSETTESQVGCSIGWLAAVCATGSALFLLTIVVVFLFCGPLKKRGRKKNPQQSAHHHHHHHHRSRSQNIDEEIHHYEDPMASKYVISPPLIGEYKTLPHWEPYAKESSDFCAHQYNDPSHNARPHIVYV